MLKMGNNFRETVCIERRLHHTNIAPNPSSIHLPFCSRFYQQFLLTAVKCLLFKNPFICLRGENEKSRSHATEFAFRFFATSARCVRRKTRARLFVSVPWRTPDADRSTWLPQELVRCVKGSGEFRDRIFLQTF